MAKKKPKITGDERVVRMAGCILFALGAFRNKPIWDNDTRTMTTWHAWFKKTLEDAGYELVGTTPEKPTNKKKE